MVKRLPTKAEVRAELEREMNDFLEQGGQVDEVPQGASGKDPAKPPTYLSGRLFNEPTSSRTYVPEVVAAIEARRAAGLKRSPDRKRSRLPRPRARRKLIYDDFGEPLRRVWVDD